MDTLLFFLLCSSCIFRTELALNLSDHCTNAKKVLEILPGRGWDSLQNQDMAQVVRPTYANCKTVDNGEYLIPDSMSTISVKETDMELLTELFEHYSKYVSVTSKSFQVGVGFPFILGAVSIAGSFSPEYSSVKGRQIADKSMTTRAYIRRTAYSVLVEPSFEVEPDLKQRIEKAARDLERGSKIELVQDAMELIVRDYGTHYQTRVDVGAILLKEDFLKSSYVIQLSGEKNQITAAAGVSFLNRVGFGFRYQHVVDDEKTEGYNKSIISTTLKTIGGPPVQPNMTESEWLSQIPNNLAVIDRSGDPLYSILDQRILPNISEDTLTKLSDLMQDVIATYFSVNKHTGCMSMDSPNFDPIANVNDHSCHDPTTNTTFGGVFVNCSSDEVEAGDLCTELQQKNPMTGGLSCPVGFQEVPLNFDTKTVNTQKNEPTEVCSGWWIFSKCHTETKTYHYSSKSRYESFWCAAWNSTSDISGLRFGGSFTSTIPNPVTRSTNCPPFFNSLSAGTDLKVCAGSDILGFKYSLEFGGFFSCKNGNPLAGISGVDAGKQTYRKYCPTGFSQHLAAMDNGCAINYCLNTDSLPFHSDVVFPLVKPPFNKLIESTGLVNAESNVNAAAANLGIAGICAIIAISVLCLLVVLLMVIKLRSRCKNVPCNAQYQTINS